MHWVRLALEDLFDQVGATPLAPTTYERSDLLGQSRCQSVTDDVRGQVCRRLPEPEHVDVFEQGVGDHAAPGTALSRRPCLGLQSA